MNNFGDHLIQFQLPYLERVGPFPTSTRQQLYRLHRRDNTQVRNSVLTPDLDALGGGLVLRLVPVVAMVGGRRIFKYPVVVRSIDDTVGIVRFTVPVVITVGDRHCDWGGSGESYTGFYHTYLTIFSHALVKYSNNYDTTLFLL